MRRQEPDSSKFEYWDRVTTKYPCVGNEVQFDADSPFEDLRLHNTILHLVVLGFYCIRNPITVVQLLLDRGATPNIQNDRGETPLHLLCQVALRDPEMVKLLLERGANPNVQNIEGKRPIDLLGVHDSYSREIRSMLEKSGI